MPRGLQALALRATLLAISTRVACSLVAPRQSQQTHVGASSFLLDGTGAEIEEGVDCDYIQNKSAQSYILLGPMDSGTNLLHQLMYAAWPSEVCMETYHIVWKHALTGVDDIYNFMLKTKSRDDLRNSVVLHTVRSPISQFASWRKAPYELRDCIVRYVEDWDQPCMANMGPYHPNEGATTEDFIGGTKPTWYKSTMEVYNQYLQQLVDLREAGWFKAVVPVSYEDMLLSPVSTLTEIAKHFEGLGEVNKDKVEYAMREPAKFEAGTVDGALQKLMDISYLQEFTSWNMKMMCNGLNKTLVGQYKSGTFLEPSRQVSYWDDCADV